MENLQHQTDYNDKLRNLRGTFAVEGMPITEESKRNLDRYIKGQATRQQIINEIIKQYTKSGK